MSTTGDDPTGPAPQPSPDRRDPDGSGPDVQDLPALVFRHSPLTLAAVAAACVFAIPFAFAAPWLWLVYLVPVGVAVWILRVRTVVDPESVTVRTVAGSRSVAWEEISSLRLGKKARVSAVLNDSAEVPLPAVHVRDLPALAAVSGGRLPDPTGP